MNKRITKAAYLAFAPHLGQNLALGDIGAPHSAQNVPFALGAGLAPGAPALHPMNVVKNARKSRMLAIPPKTAPAPANPMPALTGPAVRESCTKQPTPPKIPNSRMRM